MIQSFEYCLDYVLAGSYWQLQTWMEKQARPSINFVGFQLVSPGLIVDSPCLRFGLLDEGYCGCNHGFQLSVGYDI